MINWLIATLQLRYGNVNARLAAIETLTAMKRPGLPDQLTRALWDEDAQVRQAAMTALRLKFGIQAIDSLIRTLEEGKSIDSERAADLLEQIGQDAVPSLIDALRSKILIYGPSGFLITRTFDILVQIGQDAVPSLIDILRIESRNSSLDTDYNFQMTAARALMQIGEDAVPLLVEALSSDNPNTRELVAHTLGRIGGPETVSSLMRIIDDSPGAARSTAIVSLLVMLHYDKDKRIKAKVADILGQISQDAVPPLIDVLSSNSPINNLDGSYDLQMSAVDELVRIGQDAVPPLIDVLRSDNYWGNHRAAIALGRIGGLETVSSLMAVVKDSTGSARSAAISSLVDVLLQDKDKGTRMKTADALVQIGQEVVFTLQSALLRQTTASSVVLAAQTLGRIGGPQAVSPLITLLKDTSEPVRETATEALRTIAGRLRSKNAMERLAAVKALDVVGGSQVAESLAQTLDDEDPAVSWEAALALEKNPERDTVMTQVSALEQTKGYIPGVAYLLAQYSNPDVIDRLQKHGPAIVRQLKGENPIQRLAAVKALDAIGGSEAIGALMEILNDPDDRVSYAIAKALARRGDTATIQAKLSEWETSDKGKNYKNNEAVNTLVAASAALNSNELKRYTEGKSEETHKNIRAQLEKQLNKLLDRYAPDTFGG